MKALAKNEFEKLIAETKEISAMLQGLRRAVLNKAQPKPKRLRRNA
jgi:hypothetical protein